jgi:hypothetical protein
MDVLSKPRLGGGTLGVFGFPTGGISRRHPIGLTDTEIRRAKPSEYPKGNYTVQRVLHVSGHLLVFKLLRERQ